MYKIDIEYKNKTASVSISDSVAIDALRQQIGPADWKGGNDLNDYLNNRYWQSMLPLTAQLELPKVILDIGSGLAINDMLLAQVFSDTKFYLVDRAEFSKHYGQKRFVADPAEYGFYHSWEAVNSILAESNLKSDQFCYLDPLDKFPDNIDVVTSFFSWNWHYPFEIYWHKISAKIHSGTRVFLDVRYKKDIDQLSQAFGTEPVITKIYPKSPWLQSYNPDNAAGYRCLWVVK